MSEADSTPNAPPAAVQAVNAQKDPPPEPIRDVSRRRFIILSFWAVVICLGLPLWYRTTTVYRAKLPLDRMTAWSEGKVCHPVFPLRINVAAPSLHAAEAEHLLRLTQHALDDSNDFPSHHLRLSLVENIQYTAEFEDHNANIDHATQDHMVTSNGVDKQESAALTVKLQSLDTATTPNAYLHPNSLVLEITHSPHLVPNPSTSPSVLSTYIASQLHSIFAEERDMLRELIIPGSSSTTRLQGQDSSTLINRSTRMVKYAPTYHLTFSLFTPTAFPSAWEIGPALQRIVRPLFASLSPISNFTVDTQVQSYATFSPSVQPTYSESQNAWLIRREELGGFINAAEWPLNPGIGAGPTINFLLYVASPTQSPLLIEGSSSNSWIIPQWGGVVIYNPPPERSGSHEWRDTGLLSSDLEPALAIFASQLLSLLGLPTTPTHSLPLRLSVLTRIRAANLLLSASSTLGSLARLVAALPSISIPDTVAGSVSATLRHLDAACQGFENGHFQEALNHARVAEQEAQKAFFERSMVGQVYFPDEHKVAVYLPLLGPMAVPLLMSAVKEIMPLLKRIRRRVR